MIDKSEGIARITKILNAAHQIRSVQLDAQMVEITKPCDTAESYQPTGVVMMTIEYIEEKEPVTVMCDRR